MIFPSILLALLLILPACETEAPTGVDAAGIYRHSGNAQQGVVGTLLQDELVVFVAGPDGAAAPNRAVTFEIVEGSGRLTAETSVTGTTGLASTRLILGTEPGRVQVRATALGLKASVEFTATAVLPEEVDTTAAPGAVGIYRHSGDGQEGAVGTLLPEELVVLVVGGDGRPLAGRVVVFQVVAGGGRVSHETRITDDLGMAFTRLLLGPSPGTVVVRATAAGLEGAVDFTATAVLPEDVNAPAVPGLDDYALHFEAEHRQEVDVGLVSTTGNAYAVEAWVRLAEAIPLDREGGEIVGQHASYVDAKGTLDILKGRLRFLINMGDADHHELLSDGPVPLGRWVHLAGVYDGRDMRLYIDGQESGSVPAVGNITGYNQRRSTRLGGYAGTATDHYWFCGDLDEVRIWSTARTGEQIRAEMHHHVEAQPGLIGYWPFDDGAGLSAEDRSGNGHHGALTNYQGSGYPSWVPGVFTQVDTTGHP